MADEQTATTPATDVQAPAVPVTGAETHTTQAAPTTPAVTVEELQAQIAKMEKALKEANREEAAKRKRLTELEKAEQERQQASLSEMDKLKAQIAERDKLVTEAKAAQERALAEATTMRVKSAIIAQASALGFANPDDAYMLIDMSAVTVADNDVKGITEGLQALAKSKPYLLKGRQQPAPQVGPTNPGANAGQGITDEQLRIMIFGAPNRQGFTRADAEKHGGGVVWNTKHTE